jgi:hypothetical protein
MGVVHGEVVWLCRRGRTDTVSWTTRSPSGRRSVVGGEVQGLEAPGKARAPSGRRSRGRQERAAVRAGGPSVVSPIDAEATSGVSTPLLPARSGVGSSSTPAHCVTPMASTSSPVPSARCPVPHSLCPMPSARCTVPHSLSPVPSARCPVPSQKKCPERWWGRSGQEVESQAFACGGLGGGSPRHPALLGGSLKVGRGGAGWARTFAAPWPVAHRVVRRRAEGTIDPSVPIDPSRSPFAS